MELTEEQQMIQDTARRFADTELRPIASEIDKKGEIPMEIYQKMAEVGFMGLVIPAEHGGTGTDTVCYSIVIEEISRVCGSTGLSLAAHNSLGANPICIAGNEKQKKKYLPEIGSGEAIAAFCLTEPQAGSEPRTGTPKASRAKLSRKATSPKTKTTRSAICESMKSARFIGVAISRRSRRLMRMSTR